MRDGLLMKAAYLVGKDVEGENPEEILEHVLFDSHGQHSIDQGVAVSCLS